MAKPVLGRGLGALLGGSAPSARPAEKPTASAVPAKTEDTRERVERVPVLSVRPCPFQPRKDFPPESLQELADSIKQQGIVQPLIVRQSGGGFELIAGERRWRAAQLVGLKDVPVIVREADDRAVLELALIENLQRENLNPIEEALGYSQLIQQFQLTQEDAATKVGKSRSVVANALRLLKLDADLQSWVRDGRLSVGHAKVILGLTAHAEQKLAAERVLKKLLNVRQTEELVSFLQHKSPATGGPKSGTKSLGDEPHVSHLQNKMREKFGTKVRLRYRQGKGAIEINFYHDDDLDRILQMIGIDLD